ncbi:MerR family transcriptional regulator [Gilvimarinus sp. SDUM040013]|uniref:MerR family transcriptional regulator n=1 Tax=Gilvimarinus gilvus TaxID=3058038 RepID=A0ABU4S3L9_9GAMM|nr:MerR family transcriptional regulator [Gilvimarinus sp. SDUM040013]MDO3386905.1 MerR family transcriptional regulator [Gilvimarinus sp. SDUM040013]MDX6851539.1 MerR family transcriptional regulator [Gilvimarinus sp. SDUM040013]
MSIEKVYTVSELSRLAGISVRTLHYYDEIGLLKPIRRVDNGFREYHHEHVVMLQQVLLYRELDFSIAKIKEILTNDSYDLLKAFDDQKLMLLERISQTQLMIDSIEATMKNVKGKLNRDILFGDIPKEKIERWDGIQKDRKDPGLVGSMFQDLANLSESEAKYHREQSERFHKEYSKLLVLAANSKTVQEQVMEHYKIMNTFLYGIHDGFTGIGYNGYLQFASSILDDEVSFEMHEHYGLGLAEHLNEAMIYFAEHTLKDNLAELRKIGSRGK